VRHPLPRLAVPAALLVAGFCSVLWLSIGYTGPGDSDPEQWIDAARATGSANVVSAIYLNVRLFDTLLEVLVFSVAVLGVRFYLEERGRREPIDSIPESQVLRLSADLLLPLILLLGIYLTVYGHLSPGGGFSGGVAAGTGLLLAAIALGADAVAVRFHERILERVEWAILLCVLVLAGMPAAFGRVPLTDLLPPGTLGRLASGGSILPYNLLIGAKVFIGTWVMIHHFIQHRGEI